MEIIDKNEKICYKSDCRFFIGEKPCKYGQKFPCKYYRPDFKKILIIKLGSLGDILRTTSILSRIKKEYKYSEITWLTSEEGIRLLEKVPLIDKIVSVNSPETFLLLAEEFDFLMSFDKDYKAISIAKLVNARKKMGFTLNSHGKLGIFNYESDYAYRLGLDDELKFKKNRLTYQQMIFKMVGWEWNGEDYEWDLSEKDIFKFSYLRKKGDKIIAIHPGFGKKFPMKYWPLKNWENLVELLKEKNYKVLLCGGEEERKLLSDLTENTQQPVYIFDDFVDFSSFVANVDIMVTLDSFAMHMALASAISVISLFGPTSSVEIEGYGRLCKLSRELECSPCYMSKCLKKHECLDELFPEIVVEEIEKCVNKNL